MSKYCDYCKEEYGGDYCDCDKICNCGKELKREEIGRYETREYYKCKKCNKGHQEYHRETEPGFRMVFDIPCCNCKK